MRIHSSTLLGYGYAAPEFYPELFLYFPALLRNLGVSLCACVRVFEACIHLATAVSCYLCVRGMMNSRRVAVGASVLYTLCIYRLVNVYTRATLGESLAMIFFPVVMLGLYEVLCRDEKKWPLLALGMTGVCMSHLLSTMFCVLFCAIAALASAGKLLARKRRILAVLAAAGVTALCVLWFFVPMMQYTADGISTSVVLNSSEYVHRPGSFLVGFAGDVKADAPEDFAYTIGVVPGLALLIGCALLLARRYAAGRAEMKTENDRLALGLLALGALALGLSTDFFPWRTLCSIRSRFPPSSCRFSSRGALSAWPCRCSARRRRGAICARKGRENGHGRAHRAVRGLFEHTMQTMVQRLPELEKETYTDTRIGQFEYTYPCTEDGAQVGDVRTSQPGVCNVLSYEKRGAELTAMVQPKAGGVYRLPLLYYPGYRAEIDGQAQTVRAERTTWCASTACRRAKAARFTSGIGRRRRG
ncbi:MAG: hypothetical protein ACLUI3_01240 [Christensenellales bacterium]